MSVTWKVYVDWDNDGISAADEISSDVMDANWSLGFNNEMERVAGEAYLELRLANADRKYSPDYASGTYYGKFKPHRRVKLESISTLGTITHFVGWMQAVTPDSNIDSPYSVLTATCGKPYLERQDFSPKLWQSVTADEVIKEIIEQKREWAPSLDPTFVLNSSVLDTDTLADETQSFDFDTGLQTFTYVGDTWSEETSPMQAIADLTYGELGLFFYSRAGKATFWNRSHFATLGQTNSGTLTELDYQDIDYAYGDDVINRVKAEVFPRSINTSKVLLYSMPQSFQLSAGDERTIRGRIQSQDTEIEISTIPEDCYALVHWTPLSGLVHYTVEFDARSGVLEIVNDARYEFVDVDQFDIYGPKITRKNSFEVIAEDPDSIRTYGLREMSIPTTLNEDESLAKTLVLHELAKRKEPRGVVRTVFIRTKPDESNLATMLQWGIGTRFLIDDNPTAHQEGYFIIGESHSLSNGMKTHDVTFNLKSAAVESYFLLDTSTLDGDDVLFV